MTAETLAAPTTIRILTSPSHRNYPTNQFSAITSGQGKRLMGTAVKSVQRVKPNITIPIVMRHKVSKRRFMILIWQRLTLNLAGQQRITRRFSLKWQPVTWLRLLLKKKTVNNKEII